MDRNGYVLLDKSVGETSFAALDRVKKALDTKKVGHTGTLDKFASGLLIALVGRATKLAPWFSNCNKRYEGIIKFGEETNTLDIEGVVIAQAPVPTKEAILEVLPRFRGAFMQTPPVYSAIHVKGARASALARGGKMVEMQERPVFIHELELVDYEPPFAAIRVFCSKGTYIRSLARDIALSAGSRGHLFALRRIQIARYGMSKGGETGFWVSDAVSAKEDIVGALRPIDRAAFDAIGLPVLEAPDAVALALSQGKKPTSFEFRDFFRNFPVEDWNFDAVMGVFHQGGGFIGIIEKIGEKGNLWRYGYVYGKLSENCGKGTATSNA
ncbi:MAG: tRNA pseudouridine(55) synthase TruB [Treponema sp.]|jgi:tRNA pseudouridine55 synthase|nr:tRNA pseudouridine(55) synthase TruB [Treponema sp.]